MWSCYANWFCVMWKALAYRAFRSILSTCRVTPRRQVAWNPTWKLRKHSWSTESCSFLWRSSTSFKIKVEGHVDSPEQFALGPLICRCFLGADGKLLSLDDMQAGCFGMCPGNYKLLDFDPAWAENTTSCFVGTSSREFHTSSRVPLRGNNIQTVLDHLFCSHLKIPTSSNQHPNMLHLRSLVE